MQITIDGYKINYDDVGDGDPILMLHGWGSSLDAYKMLTAAFCNKFRMISLDFPGFGGSDMLTEAWNVEKYADFTLKFMQAIGIKNPIMIGHSFGGRVIIKMSGSGRVNPEKIILIDSAGVKHKRSLRSKVRLAAFKTGKWFLTLPPLKNHTQKALDSLRAYFGSSDYNSAPPVLRQTLVKAVNEDLQQYMPHIKAPTLLIWGENDTDTPISDAKIMEKLIPDAGLCVIKGTGHFSFIQRPYEVHTIIASFLGGN